MSRIDEALKRADEQGRANKVSGGADRAAANEATVPARTTTVPAPEIFSAPWKFDETKARGSSGDNGHGARAAASAAAFAEVPSFADDVRERLVVGEHKRNARVMAVSIEQYRRLAATLHHAQAERQIKVVMLTSAVAGEGKTLTATNLALTLSESYRRSVLLVDADLRRPGLHQIFQVPNTSGLTDLLREEAAKLTCMQITPFLTLVPAGRPDSDPMSLLTSPRMRRVMEEGAAHYDWVIVDAPPVGLLTDANLLAAMVDTTLIVVQARKTDYPIVTRAVEAIGRNRILGVVMNWVDLPQGSYGYKYGKYYDGYYGKDKHN